MKILIADDSAEMRLCIRQILSAGDDITECCNGDEAIAVFAAKRPDWVLMDIDMPQRDGLSAARAIRAEFPEACIVFVTAHNEARLRAAAVQLRGGFVLKEHLEEIPKFIEANPRIAKDLL